MTWQAWQRPAAAVLGVCALTAAVLAGMGRVGWCACASWVPWSFDTWSLHNSQHILDPYTFSHVLHGVVFYGLIHVTTRGALGRWGLAVAALLEAAWEVLENSPIIIERYRENTISLDYTGDSIANSVADILFCCSGYLAAMVVPVWASWAGFALTELVLLLWIRDSLLLNVIMLVYPLEVLKTWQAGG
jgi:hypothetical protein